MAIALVLALALAASARGVPAPDKGKPARGINAVYSYRPMYPQDTQSLLASIEERLRALDAASAVYAHQTGRLDAIEGKIDRLENALSLRVKQAAETTNARAEIIAGRLGHKIEMLELKMKSSLEASVAELEMAAESRRATVPPPAACLSPPPAVNITEQLEPFFHRVEARLDQSLRELSVPQQQSDQMAATPASLQMQTSCSSCNETLQLLQEEFHQQLNSAITKVTNMYNELWRRSTNLESLAKSGHASTEAMRQEMSEGFHSLAQRHSGGRGGPQLTAYPLEGMEQAIDTLSTTIQRKLMQANHNVVKKIDIVINNQQHFQESWMSLQHDEKQIEDEIYIILKKILDATINRSFREVQTVHNILKNHSFEMKTVTSSILQAVEGQQLATRALSASCAARTCRQPPAMRVLSDKLKTIEDSVLELHRRHQDYLSNTNGTNVTKKHMAYLLENAVQNITLNFKNSSDTCLFTLENQELQQLVNKLIELTEKVDSAFLQMEDRIHTFDKTHKYDYTDEEYNEVGDVADSSKNITTAADILIDKLSGIKEEDSEELFLEEFHDDQDDYIMTHKEKEFRKSRNRSILNDDTFFEDGNNRTLSKKTQLEDSGKNITVNISNNNPHHKRHLHNHPYDRGPQVTPYIDESKISPLSSVPNRKHFTSISSVMIGDSDDRDSDQV